VKAPARTDPSERVAAARRLLLEGAGAETAASFPGVTRLGGQIVAALYLAQGPRSMDQLVDELGCSKSNVFANVRGLEATRIIERRRLAGARHDSYTLRGGFPEVVIDAYLDRLGRVVQDKRALCHRALATLGDSTGPEAALLRGRLDDLSRKYELFAVLIDATSLDGLLVRLGLPAELGLTQPRPALGAVSAPREGS
jgi:HTH-type transcriptional regulator, osmoprotectant uptake regulator